MLRASGLVKYYGGKRALGPVSIEIGRGEGAGFLGLNGVGKSTLLRILATDLRPSAGTLEVDGIDAVRDPHAVRRRIGFLPQVPPLYPEMTVGDFLRFAGRIRGMADDVLDRRIPEVEELTGIGEVRGELVRHLSLGYRQRVGVAQAIVHDPELLILDEPTHGLDPAQVVEMRSLVRDLEERHTVLISSHNLPEISETCDRLFVLEAGRIIAAGTEAELSERLLGARRIEVAVRASDSVSARGADVAGAIDAAEAAHADPDAAGDGRADAVGATDAADGRKAVGAAHHDDEASTAPQPGAPSGPHADAIAACLRAVDGVREVAPPRPAGDALIFMIDAAGDRRAEVCRALVQAGHDVLRLDESREKLETIFLQLVGTGASAAGAADASTESVAAHASA